MKKPSTRTTKILATVATPVAVLAAGAMVLQASYAAFSGQTRNSGNEWSTGSVNLTDDDNGQSRFQVANMLPGSTDTKCIQVTANASVPSVVKGYTVNPVNSGKGLEDRIKITIESGNGGTFANCTGFAPDAAGTIVPPTTLTTLAAVDTWAEGMGGWNVAPGTSAKTYRITWQFDTTGMTQPQIDQLQGAKTGIDIQWEMQTI
jgi:hypothetical protein